MDPRQLRPAIVLSVWTVLVWTTRIRNIWTDDTLTTAGQLWRTAIAIVFTAFAAVTVAVWASARRRGAARAWVPAWLRAFALWTTGVWVVRGVQIVSADHDAAFVVVHTALAVVSVGLVWWADREAHRAPRSETLSV